MGVAVNEKTIETLLEIQELDGKIDELRTERDERPKALRRELVAVEAGQIRVDEIDQRRKEAEAGIGRLNTVLRGREEQIHKHEKSLLAPKITNKEYKAIQNEIESIRADNARTEEQILEEMERGDEIVAEIEAAQGDHRGHEAALEEAKRRVDTEVAKFDEMIAEVDGKRALCLERLESEVIRVYERVNAARGASVVAAVTEGFCQGCYMQVTTQDITRIIKGGKMHQCKTCQRILYVPNPGDLMSS